MDFPQFLDDFILKIQKKSKQVNQALWILETTGNKDAALLKAGLELELRLLFHDRGVFDKLLSWDKDPSITDPLLKRQLNILIRAFKPNLASVDFLEKISDKEAEISLLYSNFRPKIQGKPHSDNDIREILKHETEVFKRKEAWEASKEIGKILAPHIIETVRLRNAAAQSLNFSDYFSMQMELQEVDEKWLFETFDQLALESDAAYNKMLDEVYARARERFSVPKEEIGPWAWSEPFCQEDPLDSKELDALAENEDILEAARSFYWDMGFDVDDILKRSDNFEREGKNQHAFCIDIDREGDVRMLNNIKPSVKWLETVLHELGHGVYDLGISDELPWLLREPSHTITTEAMALIAGRQAYRKDSLNKLSKNSDQALKEKAEASLKRRQLIFSRWVLVMTYFERALYCNPDQDLNALWWQLVKRFQKIECQGSKSGADWAAKYHVGLAPVYYYSYLLGELLASAIEKKHRVFSSKETGVFLAEKIFKPGNTLIWSALIEKALGAKLSAKPWLSQFG